MKISFITTVFNEEKTINKFLDSLISQSKLPTEIIIVDGKSNDETIQRIKKYASKFKKKRVVFTLVIKKGNRSIGRNEAIKNATGDLIVCSDAGNILDRNWIKNITKPFIDKSVDVVSGYYKGKAKNIFQKCLIPYVLVMPDKLDPATFLPATRSIAFKKTIWEKIGGFDEELSHNEDYVFARKLKEKGAKIVFAKDAIVYWTPRNSFKEACIMFFRFALGDAEAGIWRTNVLLLLARYFLGLYFLFLSFLYKSVMPFIIISVGIILYLMWAIQKNYKYVRDKRALVILPLLQITADISVLTGTCMGFFKRLGDKNIVSILSQNKFLVGMLLVYSLFMVTILPWGIPNQFHPFPYNMDEWHQLQAVANTYRYGTPNTFGSANGTMFHFLFSGFYLIPFMLLNLVDPFSLQIDNWVMRERIFYILRFQTILFGIVSIITLYKIAEMIQFSKRLVITLFIFTPLWLSLSNYFKYDIALLFWILLSVYFFLRFWKNPTNQNFILAAIPAALTLAVKVSALPIFLLYVVSYFWFHPKWKKNLKTFFLGIGVFIMTLLLFGLPDTIFGKGNLLLYFWENVIQAPATSSNYNLGMHPLLYLFGVHYSMIFGHAFMILFLVSIGFLLVFYFKGGIVKKYKQYKGELFIIFSLFIFLVSLIPLQVFGAANRSLVVLPFMVLIIGSAVNKTLLLQKFRYIILVILSLVIGFQLFESYALFHTRITPSPQQAASAWVEKNIPTGSLIGLENIPIYQGIPDILQKEFYFNQYTIKQNNKYRYEIVDSDTQKLPPIIVITGDEIEKGFVKISPKNDLSGRIQKEKYKKAAYFSPDLTYYKLVNNLKDYYFFSWVVGSPYNISIYKK